MLRIAKNLKLPDEAVTQTFAILAKRGVGKTYTASVFAEEMLKAGLQTVIVDPIGVWWGLRSAADGKGAGLKIIIAGGDHADVPIESTSGEILADLVIDQKLSVVIDLSLFRKGEQTRFMTDFAETLYHRNRSALHLIVDEADAFAPQRPMKGQERMLGAMEDIVRRGRARGIGVTLITQRPAVLHKDVLTQIEVLVPMRLIAPQDRNAIDAWVQVHGEPGQREELMQSLPSLPIGTAWFWSPGWLDIFKRVEVRRRETLDSSSTPKAGQKIAAAKMAEVNLDKLRHQLAATIAKVEANDPKALQRRIIELERELQNQPEPVTRVEQVAVVAQDQVKELVTAAWNIINELKKFAEITVADTLDDLDAAFEVTDSGKSKRVPLEIAGVPVEVKPEVPKDKMFMINDRKLKLPPARRDAMLTEVDDQHSGKLGPGETKILAAAGQHPKGITRAHITILTGYKRSSRNTYISRLAQRDLIETVGDSIIITEAGVSELGHNFDPLPTGAALRDRLLNELPTGEKSILQVLIDAYPDGLSRDEISEKTGYMRSSRNTYLSRMSAREIIEVSGQAVRANDKLFARTS